MKILVVGMGHQACEKETQRVRSGGETKLIMVLGQWQKTVGQDLHMLCPAVSKRFFASDGLDLQYHTLDPAYDRSRFGALAAFMKRIVGVWRHRLDERFDIIFSASDLIFDVIPSVIMKSRNKDAKLVSCLYLVAPHPLKGYRNAFSDTLTLPTLSGVLFYLAQFLSIALLRRRADSIWVLNHLDKAALTKRNVPAHKIEVVSGGVDFAYFQAVPTHATNRYDAAFLGRFHPQKGLLDAIRIWKRVCEVKKDAKLALMGGGSQYWLDMIRREIHANGLENNIDLHTFMKRDDIFSIVKASRLFMLPSSYESWGIVACEAMACGVPVVAYALPFYAAVFPRGMKTVPLLDVDAFARAILGLLDDNGGRRAMAAQALDMARTYDWKAVAENELALLERIAARSA